MSASGLFPHLVEWKRVFGHNVKVSSNVLQRSFDLLPQQQQQLHGITRSKQEVYHTCVLDQRDILRGQGAIVEELPAIDQVVSYKELAVARWADQFSKLGIWNYTSFDRIAFLDSDVFPVENIDDYFDIPLSTMRLLSTRPREIHDLADRCFRTSSE
ncbi:hypothetical protein MRB53_040530 [Persea americana]|nr:hypothetical protein MRB53_040530 [Persea americana]